MLFLGIFLFIIKCTASLATAAKGVKKGAKLPYRAEPLQLRRPIQCRRSMDTVL